MSPSNQRGRGGNRAAFTTPAMLGGPIDTHPDVLTLRWLGTANFEVTFRDSVLLLDCFYDRGPRMRPLGFSPEDVVRAQQIFIGHPHFDHISDAAQVASQTGATVVGHPIAADVVIEQGLPARQTLGVTGLGDGDFIEYPEFKVRVLHGYHLFSEQEPAPNPRPAVDALRVARGEWESDEPPLTPEEEEWSARVHAKGASNPRVLEEATMCVIFEFGDFKLVYRDSAGPISKEEAGYFSTVDSVDAAIVGFTGRPLMRRQLDERTMPMVELYRPKVLMAAHHDDLFPVFMDMATEPLKMAVSHALPGTTTVAPVYLEPVRIHMPTGRVLQPGETP